MQLAKFPSLEILISLVWSVARESIFFLNSLLRITDSQEIARTVEKSHISFTLFLLLVTFYITVVL